MINFKQFMFDKGLNQSDLAQIWGVSQSLVSKVVRGERGVPEYYIGKLVEHFGKDVINQYTIPDESFAPTTHMAEVTILNPEVVEEMKEEIREEVRDEEIKTTIVLPADIIRNPDLDIKAEFKAGNLDEYAKPTQDILPANHMQVYTYCDDMEPEIRAGEPVMVQLLPPGIAIIPGNMYFIDTPSGGKIRYIEKQVGNDLYLKARNPAYGDIVISRDNVQSIFLVKLILRTPRSMSSRESALAEMIERKDEQIERVLNLQGELVAEIREQSKRNNALVDKIINKD